MEDAKRLYAVLTGDVVGSSKLTPADLKTLMQKLRAGADRFAKAFPDSVCGKLDVFSGDGWQLLMPDWIRSLRAALFLRAIVKSDAKTKSDTRIAIAWGAVDQDTLNPERISESTGEAFTLSGLALKQMRKHSRLILDDGRPSAEGRFLRVSVGLVDELAVHWRPRQAQTLALALLNHSQEEIAAEIGKSQPTVNQALQAAGWRGIEDLLDEIKYRYQSL